MATRSRKLSLFLTDPANEFIHAVAAEAADAARRRGFSLDVHFADNQALQQIQQIYAALRAPEAERPEAILVMPMHDATLERVARSAAGAGVGWMCLHRATGDLDALRREFPSVPIALVSPDQEEIGRIQGRKLLALLPEGGSVLYVQGRSDNSSVPRRASGLREAIAGSRVRLGEVIDGNWSLADAEREVGRWLRLMIAHVPVDVVACQNDAMAIGARRALQEAAPALGRPDLADLPVIGCDGLLDVGRKLVDSGELAATVILPMPGGPAIELFVDALKTHRMPQAQVTLRPEPYPPGPDVRVPVFAGRARQTTRK